MTMIVAVYDGKEQNGFILSDGRISSETEILTDSAQKVFRKPDVQGGHMVYALAGELSLCIQMHALLRSDTYRSPQDLFDKWHTHAMTLHKACPDDEAQAVVMTNEGLRVLSSNGGMYGGRLIVPEHYSRTFSMVCLGTGGALMNVPVRRAIDEHMDKPLMSLMQEIERYAVFVSDFDPATNKSHHYDRRYLYEADAGAVQAKFLDDKLAQVRERSDVWA